MESLKEIEHNIDKRRTRRERSRFNRRQEKLDSKIRKEKQKYTFKSILSKLKFETYTKRLVFSITVVALFDLQLSYVLAFMGHDQIAESLSQKICEVIIGTILVYSAKAFFETRSEKNNELIREGYITKSNSMINNKVREVLSNTGLSDYIDDEDVLQPETEDPDDYCG